MNSELEMYLNRRECRKLSEHKRELLRRYVRRFKNDMPVGRILANGLIKLNSRYKGFELVPTDFVNWLYYY
jgi:hypothetical protein